MINSPPSWPSFSHKSYLMALVTSLDRCLHPGWAAADNQHFPWRRSFGHSQIPKFSQQPRIHSTYQICPRQSVLMTGHAANAWPNLLVRLRFQAPMRICQEGSTDSHHVRFPRLKDLLRIVRLYNSCRRNDRYLYLIFDALSQRNQAIFLIIHGRHTLIACIPMVGYRTGSC